MIELVEVTKEYEVGAGRVMKAVDNVSVRFGEGEWCMVLGPNGSGKSTLLKLIAGSIFPTYGKIFLDGAEISSLPQYRRAKVFQFIEQHTEENLVPSMTVKENLLLVFNNLSFPSLRLADGKERQRRISETLACFGMNLEEKLNVQSRFLSGGEKQALCIAKAMLSNARALLLDEFLAAIDPKTAPAILRIVRDMAASQGMTVIMVSHDIDEAISCQSRVIFMNEGKIVADLSKEEVSKEKLLSLYTRSLEGSMFGRGE